MVVTKEEFERWLQDEVTEAFKKALFNDREVLKEYLLGGTDNDEKLRGKAEAIGAILTMNYEDLVKSLSEKV